MSEQLKEISGKISEDLNEAAELMAQKLGVEKPGGPNSLYTICKRENLKITFDFGSDEFSVVFKEKVQEQAPDTPEKEGANQEKEDDDDYPF